MKKICLAFLLGIFLYTAGHYCQAADEPRQEERIKYILISSEKIDHVNSLLRQTIKTLFPAAEETYLDCDSKEAKAYIEEFGIKFVPFIIYDREIALTDQFFHMVRHAMIEKVKGRYLVPQRQLKAGEIMVLGRKRSPGDLTIFARPNCPYTRKAQARLINFVKKNRLNVRLNWKYLVKVPEAGTPARSSDELLTAARQVIIQKDYPRKFHDYLLLIQDKNTEEVLQELDIPLENIGAKEEEALQILRGHYEDVRDLQVMHSPTFLWENIYLIPTLDGLEQHKPFKRKEISRKMKKSFSEPLIVDFFFSTGCSRCREAEKLMPQLQAKYKHRIKINYHNISADPEELARKYGMEEEYGMLGEGVPEVFIQDIVLKGGPDIQEKLTPIVEEILGTEATPDRKEDKTAKDKILKQKIEEEKARKEEAVSEPVVQKTIFRQEPVVPQDPNPIIRRFSSFSPAVVISLGLVDGINPCAFATMIFFVSLLALNSYQRRQIVFVGTTFIVGVFLTYLAIGLGIFQALQKLEVFYLLSRIIYYIIALVALGLGAYNLGDYIRYKKTGQMKGCSLRFYERLRSLADSRRPLVFLLIATFVTGCIVALFEFPCTGQVYFPTIAFVMKIPRLRLQGLFYLIVYNLSFILPLIGVFILAERGISSERFTQFSNKHAGAIKLTTAMLFLALALLLFILS